MLTIKRLGLTDAEILIEGARNKAIEIGVPMCIAVADESGSIIAVVRMDGSKPHSATVAQEKAYTSGSSRKATHELSGNCVPGKPLYGIQRWLCIVGGGVPIQIDGDHVGSIGVSSGSPAQDLECAEAGIAHFLATRNA